MTRPLDPPAGLPMPDALRERWVDYLHRQFEGELTYIRQRYGPGNTPQKVHFVDPTQEKIPAVAQLHEISWSGFPRRLMIQERDGDLLALPTAEELEIYPAALVGEQSGTVYPIQHRSGDEYLEWRAEHRNGRLYRITFTCEPPDYWSALAQGFPSPFFMNPDDAADQPPPGTGQWRLVLDWYKKLLGHPVPKDDLTFRENVTFQGKPAFREGDYNPWNRWNVADGIVHLSHPENTLGEEIELIGDASILRSDASGRQLRAAKCLLCCGGFGNINRSSDPAIGAAVNEIARSGRRLTIANPIGLYMSHLEDDGWTRPDGSPVSPDYWQVVREAPGTPGLAGSARAVRAIYQVPDGETYTAEDGRKRPLQVGDLRIGGEPIRYAGQVAQAVQMVDVLATWPADPQLDLEAVLCEPEYRCCRRRSGGEFLLLRQTPEGERADCADGDTDAFEVTTRSADAEFALQRKANGGAGPAVVTESTAAATAAPAAPATNPRPAPKMTRATRRMQPNPDRRKAKGS
jgi:hypothetical protein